MTLSVATARRQLDDRFEKKKDKKKYVITICGGGNGAHVAAGYLSSKGMTVNVLTRQPDKWGDHMVVSTAKSSWSNLGTLKGQLNCVSSKPETVIPQAHVILIAAPANAHPDLLDRIEPFLSPGQMLGALFAQGGFDWAVKKSLGHKLDTCLDLLFGLQNIPWICKATTYGHAAKIIGPKQKLYVACYPVDKKTQAIHLIETLFDIPTEAVANFLNLTLTPSNQIIHPGRYYGIFHDWDGQRTYTRAELEKRKGLTLYADMDQFSAEQMAMLDNELQQIKAALLQRFPALDLSDVLPLKDRVVKHYGQDVSDQSSLQAVFATNLGYAGCATPLKQVGSDAFQPVVASRLFWEDIPYGLCILKNMAELLDNFPTPRIDFMIRWHQQFMGVEFIKEDNQLNPQEMWRTGAPDKYGIHTIAQLVETSMSPELYGYRPPTCRSSFSSRL